MVTSGIELTNTDIFIRIALSLIAGMVIGMERGSKSQPAGIRTHSVVCVAACLIMMTNGTILVTDKKKVTGLTTAAGIWGSAGIGLAIGVGFYQGAILAAVSIWGVISMFQPLKMYLQKRSRVIELYIVVNSTEAYNRVLVYCAENRIRITDSRTAFGEVNQSRIQYFDVPEKKIASFVTLELAGSFEHLRLMEELSNLPGVIYVEEIS